MDDRTRRRRIIVVEDDASIAAALVRGLRQSGFEIELCAQGGALKKTVRSFRPDAIVLDLMLPDIAGEALLADLRAFTEIPVVVLTARSDLGARLECFELGATDFMTKPYFLEELVARLRLRMGLREDTPSTIKFGVASLDPGSRRLHVDGVDVALTRAEFDLLHYLAARPDRVVPRGRLVEVACPDPDDSSERIVDVHVSRLRRKLGSSAGHLATVRGVGYRFDPESCPPSPT